MQSLGQAIEIKKRDCNELGIEIGQIADGKNASFNDVCTMIDFKKQFDLILCQERQSGCKSKAITTTEG